MAADEDLQQFVREALGRGVPRGLIEAALADAGWRPEQVRRALSGFAEVDFPVPVPRPRPYLSAREAFLYLVLFATLYVSALSLGQILFELIDRAFPDPAAQRPVAQAFRDAVRWGVANLIVAFPVYLALTVSQLRAVERDPARRASRVRKWLTYLTLFVGAGVIIGDLIALVHGFLGGELTARFALKALVVGAIAGTVFGYYLWDLRQDETESPS